MAAVTRPEQLLAPGLRQRKTRRYDPFTEAWTEVVITEPEPEPEPEPPAELLEDVDLGSSSPVPAATTAAAAEVSSSSRPIVRAPSGGGRSTQSKSAATSAPPGRVGCVHLTLATVLVLAVSQLALAHHTWISTALGAALRQASVAHDSAAVCALDAAELAYWSTEAVSSDPESVASVEPVLAHSVKDLSANTKDCLDDPEKVLLGSDCVAYSLHPGCEQDLHALYDGAIYGKEFSGQTVGMICPRTCGLCS